MDQDNLSALKAYSDRSYYEPCQTISLADTVLTPGSPHSYRSESVSTTYADGDDKKPTKKRKSWGQELPTPKTNLPPRKRAKTEDEKEQRRIERVLRNRQAAQSSRERKRLEVEKLEGEKGNIEQQNKALRDRIQLVEQDKYRLQQEVAKLRAALGQQAPLSPEPESEIEQSLQQQWHTPTFTIKEEIDEHPFSMPSPDSLRACSPTELVPGSTVSTASDMTQHPAVSVHSGFEPLDLGSTLLSRHASISSSRTPSVCNTSPLSDDSYSRLFDGAFSPEPATSFFEEGYITESAEADTDAFSFDALVDLDAPLTTDGVDVVDFASFDPPDDQARCQFDLFVS